MDFVGFNAETIPWCCDRTIAIAMVEDVKQNTPCFTSCPSIFEGKLTSLSHQFVKCWCFLMIQQLNALSILATNKFSGVHSWHDLPGQIFSLEYVRTSCTPYPSKFQFDKLNNVQARALLLQRLPQGWLRAMFYKWLELAPNDNWGSSSLVHSKL